MRFYSHNVTESRRMKAERDTAASKLHDFSTPAWTVETQILTLEHVAENGLPDCYNDGNWLSSWTTDFYMDFPWTPQAQIVILQAMLEDERLPAIAEKFGDEFDVAGFLRGGLSNAQSQA